MLKSLSYTYNLHVKFTRRKHRNTNKTHYPPPPALLRLPSPWGPRVRPWTGGNSHRTRPRVRYPGGCLCKPRTRFHPLTAMSFHWFISLILLSWLLRYNSIDLPQLFLVSWFLRYIYTDLQDLFLVSWLLPYNASDLSLLVLVSLLVLIISWR